MDSLEQTLEKAARRERLLEAAHLQEIESNPLSAEEMAMFEMFDREGWSDEQCRAHILKMATTGPDIDIAAE